MIIIITIICIIFLLLSLLLSLLSLLLLLLSLLTHYYYYNSVVNIKNRLSNTASTRRHLLLLIFTFSIISLTSGAVNSSLLILRPFSASTLDRGKYKYRNWTLRAAYNIFQGRGKGIIEIFIPPPTAKTFFFKYKFNGIENVSYFFFCASNPPHKPPLWTLASKSNFHIPISLHSNMQVNL